MKTMTGATIAALAFGLGLASTPVIAADSVYAQYGGQRDRGQDATQEEDKDNKGDENKNRRRGNRDKADEPATAPTTAPTGSSRTNTDYNSDRTRDGYDRDGDRDRSFDSRRDRDGRDYNRDRRSPSFNINIYRRNITSPRRYRHSTFRYPSGFSYRRWHYGQRLPVVFWRTRDYWLLDYIAFGLFAPPPGYVWVRYGPDALLIDTYTGEIVQVRYDVFYS